MRLSAFLILAFATLAAAQWSGNDLNMAVCQITDSNDGSLPWPFPDSTAPSRKLLNIEAEAEDLTHNGRTLDTVTMYWYLWQTVEGKCATTTKLPPAFVTAATYDFQKVAPGGACNASQSSIDALNAAVLKKYAKKMPEIYRSEYCIKSYLQIYVWLQGVICLCWKIDLQNEHQKFCY